MRKTKAIFTIRTANIILALLGIALALFRAQTIDPYRFPIRYMLWSAWGIGGITHPLARAVFVTGILEILVFGIYLIFFRRPR